MKRSKYTESQTVFALHQAETGTPVAEVYRKMGIGEATFYNWKNLRKNKHLLLRILRRRYINQLWLSNFYRKKLAQAIFITSYYVKNSLRS